MPRPSRRKYETPHDNVGRTAEPGSGTPPDARRFAAVNSLSASPSPTVAEVASSAWVLAQLGEASEALTRLREGEQLLEHNAAKGIFDNHGGDYHWLGRAALLLGRLDEARVMGDRAFKYSPSHPGFVAHVLHLLGDIATHPPRFDAESGAAHYRQALALAARHAPAHRPLSPRPRQASRAHGQAAGGAGAPHHRGDAVL